MTIHTSDLPRYHRRNWLGYFGDYVFFGLGLTFASTATVLPALAAQLTTSKVLIGAVSAVWTGGWLLPQLFAANFVSSRKRKLPIVMKGGWIGRPIMLLFPVYLALVGTRHPALTLLLLLLSIAFFAATDAVVAIAWFDMLGKTLEARGRGRLIGVGQVVNGVLAIGAGALIARLLGSAGPGFPLNYAIILGLAGLCFMASLWSMYLLVEPHEDAPEHSGSLREYLPRLAALLRADRNLARLNLIRLLVGAGAMAVPFYALFAVRAAGVGEARIGVFATAQTIGTALAGLVFGPLAERRGSQRVIQAVAASNVLVPLLALTLPLLFSGVRLEWLYPLIFVLLGMGDGAAMLGYFNYVLEIAPPGERPAYMGLTNTFSGVLLVAPLLGGWILERSSYGTVFALAAALALSGALLSLTLHDPRKR